MKTATMQPLCMKGKCECSEEMFRCLLHEPLFYSYLSTSPPRGLNLSFSVYGLLLLIEASLKVSRVVVFVWIVASLGSSLIGVKSVTAVVVDQQWQ